MKIYKHKNEKYYKLLIKRESDINTYLEVYPSGEPTIKKRNWSIHPEEQKAIIKGFDNLTLIK